MREASHFESVDQGSSFLGARTDGVCENEQAPELTQRFTSSMALLKRVRRADISPLWTDGDLMKLQDRIVINKLLCKSVLETYQPSGTGT